MKIITNICRVLVGFLFIVSGLVKANDTIGFGYKLEEYFSEGVLNMPFFIPYATAIAAIICVIEIVLGVAALMGIKMKITAWALLLLNVFFTFLTFYSAYFNKVNDCGCFGDALHLTPWSSFTKDVVLTTLSLIIFLRRKDIAYNLPQEDKFFAVAAVICSVLFCELFLKWTFPWIFTLVVLALCIAIKLLLLKNLKPSQWILIGFTTLVTCLFSFYTYSYLPIKDFRPYKVGTNILKAMEVPPGAPRSEYKTIIYYEKGGVVKEFDSKNYPWDDSTWVWKDTKNILIKEGYKPPIHDFAIKDADGGDYTQEFLNKKGYSFMLVSYELQKIDRKVQPQINAFVDKCNKAGIEFIGLTSNSATEIDNFRHDVNAMYNFYICDQTALKTIIRSNPGLVMLKDGTVVAMWHHNSFPTFEEVKTKYGF